jgi:hypothetical protein
LHVEEKWFLWFATIPRNLRQCDACILGKHNIQPFHDSTSRACIKIELIHSDLCGPIPIASTFGNKYIMAFIDDYTNMCWVYFLKHKYQEFETFRNFHVCIENEAHLVLTLFVLIMEGNIPLMSLKYISGNMESNIKPLFHTILSRMA